MLIQKLQIGRYLGINVTLWGVFLAFQAATQTFQAELALRFVSGMFEAIADPCFMAVTIMWYTRREQPIRIGIWYAANGAGLSFGGLIGYAIGLIKSHIAGWRLEFLVVGLLCTAWGLTVFFACPSSPLNTRWLTPREKNLAVARLQANATGIESKEFKWSQIREAAIDWKTYAFFLFAVSGNVPAAGISNFGTLVSTCIRISESARFADMSFASPSPRRS
jgi:MFS family permease